MEYFYYLLVILALVALCLYLVRLPGHVRLTRNPADLADRARKLRQQQRRAGAGESPLPLHYERIIQRELRNVPTPWGWPGSTIRHGGLRAAAGSNGVPGPTGSLQGWIDLLISEKRTVDDHDYRLRKDASLRALLEDRFGRPVQPSQVPYVRTKPPLLRDPGRPYDQQDNFPSGRTAAIVSKLKPQPGKPALPQREPAARKSAALRDIRTPWGW